MTVKGGGISNKSRGTSWWVEKMRSRSRSVVLPKISLPRSHKENKSGAFALLLSFLPSPSTNLVSLTPPRPSYNAFPFSFPSHILPPWQSGYPPSFFVRNSPRRYHRYVRGRSTLSSSTPPALPIPNTSSTQSFPLQGCLLLTDYSSLLSRFFSLSALAGFFEGRAVCGGKTAFLEIGVDLHRNDRG